MKPLAGHPLALEWLPGRYAVCRCEPGEALPPWADITRAAGTALWCATRTDKELSVVVDEALVPPNLPGMKVERGFAAMRIVGTLDFSLVGILSRLTGFLATAQIPVFAVSTFETDYLLVPAVSADRAEKALESIAEFKARLSTLARDAQPRPPG